MGALHNLLIPNQLTVVRLIQDGYDNDDQCIIVRKLFGAELKVRITLAEHNTRQSKP